MSCTPQGIKIFLVTCNIVLLFVGASVLILGLKMKWALASLLINVPVIAKAFKAIISTGFFISVAGLTGIIGACYEILWLITAHLYSLAVIVIMEFALGVTLIFIRTTIESYVDSPDCNKSCAVTLDAVVLDYALPSSGLMMTIIIVEALMIYCAMKMYSHIKYAPKSTEDLNVQMQNVSGQPLFPPSPYPVYSIQPVLPCFDDARRPRRSPFRSPYQYPDSRLSPKPPQYSAAEDQPPTYSEVVPSANRTPIRGMAQRVEEHQP